jgi:steroid 5-alpha reductase family enzyme
MTELTGYGLPLTVTLAATLVVFSFLWLIHDRRKDASIVDYWWAAGFAAIAWIHLALTARLGPIQFFVTAAVTVWAVRLTYHLVARHRAKGGVEDIRYTRMREAGGPDWPRRNLFTVFWLQAVLQWLLATPVHVALLAAPVTAPTGSAAALAILGGFVFLAGFTIEWIADAQMTAFRRLPGTRGRLCTTGLRAWSRHPHYFGETLVWFGLGLVAAAASGLWWTLAAPALLTLLLLKVSGIPPLEAELERRPGWAAYRATTNAFIPLPPTQRVSREGAE